MGILACFGSLALPFRSRKSVELFPPPYGTFRPYLAFEPVEEFTSGTRAIPRSQDCFQRLARFVSDSGLGWARFAKKIFSLISEIKRIWIRFTCVSLFHYKISLLFFRFFSLLFASNFSLRFTWVIFASKRNKAKRKSSLFFSFFHFFSLFFAFFRIFFTFFRFFSL
jgi:hypothetical protein